MKLQFKTQAHQTAAVQAVVGCFKGQPPAFSGGDDCKNADLALSDSDLLANIHAVQRERNLLLSDSLVKTPVAQVNLDIEMETGTGKTYCYIKTIFELNRQYGWSKFIIVVPSIAIREGVMKSLQITAEHFGETYRKKARCFAYHSKQLHQLESFSSDAGINVMVINVQAFAARGADNRRIYEALDDFQSCRPIDVISAKRPILILDEPQKMEGATTLRSLEAFRALMVLRYSATHKTPHNKIHRLDALDAYNQKLVKKIAVRGISVNGLAGTAGYLYLQSIEVSNTRPPEARVELEHKLAGGRIRRTLRKLSKGADLFDLSNGLEQYRNGYVVTDIDANADTVSFTNGVQLKAGDAIGDVTEATLRRIQIREAIQAHFDKEQALFEQGVKVLTLFFIDEVVKYRDYAALDDKGEYARLFEEEYGLYLGELLDQAETPYIRHLKGIPAEKTHRGYFSVDNKSRRLADPSVIARGENAGQSDDADAYDLILKDKEQLLSLTEPVRFIFSHSALREGWDNPNVFVICTLKQSDHTISRRQEVGRGLRLAVNQRGERMDHPATVHDINVLTVVASESYKDFVTALQKDIRESLSGRSQRTSSDFSETPLPDIGDDRKPKKNPLNANFDQPAFQELWGRINRKAYYRVAFEAEELVRRAIRRLNDHDTGLRVSPLHFAIQHGEQAVAVSHDRALHGDTFELKHTATQSRRTPPHASVNYDLVGKLSEGTQLTRRMAAEVLKGLDAAVFAQFKTHPEAFIAEAIRIVAEEKAEVARRELGYEPLDDKFPLSIFTAGQTRQDFSQAVRTPRRHIYDFVLPGSGSMPERLVAELLETHENVAVYAKLPLGYAIPTPVGDYTPDWAILLQEGSAKHTCLVVETKGALSSMKHRGVERIKIACATRFFETMNVQYRLADSAEKLMAILQGDER